MSVADYIYANIEQIINFCNKNPSELGGLLDLNTSKQLFDLNYAFFIETNNIDDTNGKRSSARYISKIYTVNNKSVRITNDWYKRNIPYFNDYLAQRNIVPVGTIKTPAKTSSSGNNTILLKKSTRKNSRYKGNAIGNSQNRLIRNILSNLGEESFSEDDWINTKKYFDNKCAYCGSEEELIIEHAIPINKEKLGEHRIGNIVPACKKCNSNKGDKDYREYLENKISVIKKIDEYMESRHYIPLEDNEKLKNILNIAYEEVSSIAEKYINIINDIFINNNDGEK
jgi:5-methylcytosine-specific restriction endonuclease McrA